MAWTRLLACHEQQSPPQRRQPLASLPASRGADHYRRSQKFHGGMIFWRPPMSARARLAIWRYVTFVQNLRPNLRPKPRPKLRPNLRQNLVQNLRPKLRPNLRPKPSSKTFVQNLRPKPRPNLRPKPSSKTFVQNLRPIWRVAHKKDEIKSKPKGKRRRPGTKIRD